jgi:hypothetical protein
VHTFESAPRSIGRLRALLEENGRSADAARFQICLGGPVDTPDDIKRWEELGVTRLIVSPWARSKEAIEGMRRFADMIGLAG